MSAESQDLLTVFDVVPTSGLRSLARALRRGLVIRGRFTNATGGGCLMYWLSEKEIVDRPSRRQWTKLNPFCTEDVDLRIRKLIAAWDAALPAGETLKGVGYEAEYPKPSYVLDSHTVRRTLAIVLAARRRASSSERAAAARLPASVGA